MRIQHKYTSHCIHASIVVVVIVGQPGRASGQTAFNRMRLIHTRCTRRPRPVCVHSLRCCPKADRIPIQPRTQTHFTWPTRNAHTARTPWHDECVCTNTQRQRTLDHWQASKPDHDMRKHGIKTAPSMPGQQTCPTTATANRIGTKLFTLPQMRFSELRSRARVCHDLCSH